MRVFSECRVPINDNSEKFCSGKRVISECGRPIKDKREKFVQVWGLSVSVGAYQMIK